MNAPATTVSSNSPTPVMLEPLQVQAALLLSQGHSFSEVCQALSVGRATLFRWRQQPDFAAYLNQLLRQCADHATTRSTKLLELAHDYLEEQLTNPDTPAKVKLQIAFRIAALYSKPAHLKYLQSLPEDPELIADDQARHASLLSGLSVNDMDGSDVELYQCYQKDRLPHAQAFDARYPNPEALLKTTPRDKMNQNETLGAPLASAMRQNETSGARAPKAQAKPTGNAACTSAINAALAGVQKGIALATA